MKQELIKALKALSKEQWEDLEDGHGTFKPKFYTEMGFPDHFVKNHMTEIVSDGTWKGSLWKDQDKAIAVIAEIRSIPKGKPIPEDLEKRFTEVYIPKVTGINNLDFLFGLCDAVKVHTGNPFIGRGFQARHLVGVLQNFTKNQ